MFCNLHYLCVCSSLCRLLYVFTRLQLISFLLAMFFCLFFFCICFLCLHFLEFASHLFLQPVPLSTACLHLSASVQNTYLCNMCSSTELHLGWHELKLLNGKFLLRSFLLRCFFCWGTDILWIMWCSFILRNACWISVSLYGQVNTIANYYIL